MSDFRRTLFALLVLCPLSFAQEKYSYRAPEQLGNVSFPISCSKDTQEPFNRGMALVHSFAYGPARDEFHEVAERDPQCAMAHWGIAFSFFHQLWDPPIVPSTIAQAQREIQRAQQIGARTERESEYIEALSLVYKDASTVPYSTRAANYERAMSVLASKNRKDIEGQVLYALALLANASPRDKAHLKQKQAANILEPLGRIFPRHPGILHYLIHAYDNAELAKRGLPAARDYSRIAPSAPHALHMPSHIFTRLGLWDESIQANLAAKKAAHQQGDAGEELHAMDYLVYAYLQLGRATDAAQVIQQLKKMPRLDEGDFKIAYASTAMPIRYAVERHQWTEAASIVPPAGAPPHVMAIAIWARGLGLARSGRPDKAREEIARLAEIEQQLRASGDVYWATQIGILRLEVAAWCAQSERKAEDAVAIMRKAADDEDSIEKLPVTPGPIVPAREQLGDMLLEQNRPALALKEFRATLVNAPGRHGALLGASRAAEISSRE